MFEIEVDKNTPITSRMKLFANELSLKEDFISVYNKIGKSSDEQEKVTKLWKIKTAVLSTFINTLKNERKRKFFAISEISKAIIERGYCSKGRLSVIIKEFVEFNILIESTVIDKKINRIFNMISFPDSIEELELSVDKYIDHLVYLNKFTRTQPANIGQVKSRLKSLSKNLTPYTAKVELKEKNVVVINEGKGTSILSILSSICPVEKTTMQDGTLMFKNNYDSKNSREISSVHYKARTWSDSDGIMRFEDLKVYYALISLIYHAHLARFSEYYSRKSQLVNLTHFHIDNILNLTTSGRTNRYGGSQREKCRQSLDRIYKTVIELRSDEKVDLSHIASSSDSKELESIGSGTKVTPVEYLFPVQYEEKDNTWGKSTMDYIVKLPEDLFSKIFTSKFHWVFPPSSLMINELMFALYHYIRTNWKASKKVKNALPNKKNVSLIEFYYQCQSPTDTFSIFLNKLHTLLNKLSKSTGTLHSGIKRSYYSVVKSPYKKEYKLKLFGYICNIDIDNEELTVELKEELFYEALGIGSTTRKSPTLSNKLSHLNYVELLNKGKLTSEEEESLITASNYSKKIVSKSNSLSSKINKIIPVETKQFGFIRIKLGTKSESTYQITLLSDNEYIDLLVKEISQILAIPAPDISRYIHELKDSIPNTYNSKRISIDDFKVIYEKYLRSEGTQKDSIDKQIEFFELAKNEPKVFSFMLSF